MLILRHWPPSQETTGNMSGILYVVYVKLWRNVLLHTEFESAVADVVIKDQSTRNQSLNQISKKKPYKMHSWNIEFSEDQLREG